MGKRREFFVCSPQIKKDPYNHNRIVVELLSKKQMKQSQDDESFICFREVLPNEPADNKKSELQKHTELNRQLANENARLKESLDVALDHIFTIRRTVPNRDDEITAAYRWAEKLYNEISGDTSV